MEIPSHQVFFLKACELAKWMVGHLDHTVFIQQAEAFGYIIQNHLCDLLHVQCMAQLLVGQLKDLYDMAYVIPGHLVRQADGKVESCNAIVDSGNVNHPVAHIDHR